MDTEAMPVLPAPVKRNLNVLMELSDGGLTGNQQATPDDGADPGHYQAQLVNRSRQTKFGHHLRLPDLVCSLNAPGIECSRRISQPSVGDTKPEWYRVWRGARPAPVLCVLNACRFPPGWRARRRRAASLAADVPSKCGSRPPGTHSAAGVAGLPNRSRRPKAARMWLCSSST